MSWTVRAPIALDGPQSVSGSTTSRDGPRPRDSRAPRLPRVPPLVRGSFRCCERGSDASQARERLSFPSQAEKISHRVAALVGKPREWPSGGLLQVVAWVDANPAAADRRDLAVPAGLLGPARVGGDHGKSTATEH